MLTGSRTRLKISQMLKVEMHNFSLQAVRKASQSVLLQSDTTFSEMLLQAPGEGLNKLSKHILQHEFNGLFLLTTCVICYKASCCATWFSQSDIVVSLRASQQTKFMTMNIAMLAKAYLTLVQRRFLLKSLTIGY